MSVNILDELIQRGYIKQTTDEHEIRQLLSNGQVTFYIGFDPTSDCLHIGHLLPIMCMAHLQKAGHRPLIILGGGTAMVGDPSGKDKTRDMLTEEQIHHNLESQKKIFGQFLDLDNAKVLNNGAWLKDLNYISFLRDIGKHFSVNKMIKAEGAKQRLERDQGYSFIEFNYHLLQSYDFLHLHREYGCVLQVGGDDQWFHFCGGIELIRKECGNKAFAFTIPLLTTAEGKKMGKTEKGAVWIDPTRMSSFDYYQYWVNVLDQDVIRMMKLFTFMPLAEIETYGKLQGADIRQAKHKLAYEVVKLAHGEAAATKAQQAAKQAFSGSTSDDMPTFVANLPAPVVDLLADSKLCKSRSDARRMIKGGAVKVDYGNGKEKLDNISADLDKAAVLWVGKKRCVRITVG